MQTLQRVLKLYMQTLQRVLSKIVHADSAKSII